MNEDRKRITKLDAEIARYDAEISRRINPVDPIDAGDRMKAGCLGAFSLFVGSLPLGLAVIALGARELWVALWVLWMTLSPVGGFLYGYIKGNLMPTVDPGEIASRELDARDRQINDARTQLAIKHRDRLVADRAQLVKGLAGQVGGGLSLSEDSEQRGELSVSEK